MTRYLELQLYEHTWLRNTGESDTFLTTTEMPVLTHPDWSYVGPECLYTRYNDNLVRSDSIVTARCPTSMVRQCRNVQYSTVQRAVPVTGEPHNYCTRPASLGASSRLLGRFRFLATGKKYEYEHRQCSALRIGLRQAACISDDGSVSRTTTLTHG